MNNVIIFSIAFMLGALISPFIPIAHKTVFGAGKIYGFSKGLLYAVKIGVLKGKNNGGTNDNG